jgi:hypothetical protein
VLRHRRRRAVACSQRVEEGGEALLDIPESGKTVGGGVGQEQRGLRGTLRRWGQDGAMSDAAPSPNPAVCQLRVVLAGAL